MTSLLGLFSKPGARTSEMTHAFWGPPFMDAELAALLIDHHVAMGAEGCTVQKLNDLPN